MSCSSLAASWNSLFHLPFLIFFVPYSTEFLITASCDGHIKFWKKQEEGIEFVKHFKVHLGKYCVSLVSNLAARLMYNVQVILSVSVSTSALVLGIKTISLYPREDASCLGYIYLVVK